jgi:ferredoxin-fold anticodon binding domain-containing protein
MGLKTFNVDEIIYKKYSGHCKKEGISMSKRVETFMRQELEKIERESGKTISDIGEKPKDVSHSMQRYC